MREENPTLHCLSPIAGTLNDILTSLEIKNGSQLLAFGAIYHNRKRICENVAVQRGDYLRIHRRPKRFPVSGIDWKARVISESAEFVIVDKPAGIPVHATLDNLIENVGAQLSLVRGSVLLPTHRLDVPTEGLVVFAKTVHFQSRFNGWLFKREVEKRYRARVENSPGLGTFVHFMEPSPRAPKKVSPHPNPDWQRCELEILAEEKAGTYWDLTIELKTGRTHQIRSQLAALGCPILGDILYGGTPWEKDGTIALQSRYLKFDGNEFELTRDF